jgi:O-antigen/teichoic acid export membrane protein
VLVRGETPLRPAVDWTTWKAILRETLPYALAAAVGLVYFRIAVILMSYVSSDVETGYFSAAFRIVEVVGVVPWLLVTAGFPILARAARDDDERLRYALQRMFEVAAVVGTFNALLLGVAAPFAIEVVAGDGFEQSVSVLRIQAVGLITTFLLATWQFALLSLKLYRPLLIANTLAALVASAGTIALSPSMGAEGAAVATVAAELTLAVCCLIALVRANEAMRPDLLVVPKVALAAGVAIGVAALVPAHSLVLAMVAAVVYLIVLVPLRAIPPEVITALRRRDPGMVGP